MNLHHAILLRQIQQIAGLARSVPAADRYLGNQHPKYQITNPQLRQLARVWVRSHQTLSAAEFKGVLTSLVAGNSSTEKMLPGMLLDAARPHQRNFEPAIFERWLSQLEGWAEVDTLCASAHTKDEVLQQWAKWKKLLTKLNRSQQVTKRRASLVFLCTPVRHHQDAKLARLAFANIDRLKGEKDPLITKAISWLLRSMVKQYRTQVVAYLNQNKTKLPALAVREILIKIKTGRKTKPR
jgi:3-methyladenine DNA glycosylase AlkD